MNTVKSKFVAIVIGFIVLLSLVSSGYAEEQNHVIVAAASSEISGSAEDIRDDAHEAKVRSESFADPKIEHMFIRGIERNEKRRSDTIRHVINAGLFIPRHAIDGLLYPVSYGIGHADEIEDILFFFDDKLGWYPLLESASGFSPLYGLKVRYNDERFGVSLRGRYASGERWESKAKMSYSHETDGAAWEIGLAAFIEQDDNRDFFGIGSDPMNDPRSFFISPNADFDNGAYFQRRENIQLTFSLRPSAKWKLLFTNFYQKRTITDPSEERQRIGVVFDLSKLPGAQEPAKQIYNEISARFDTRKYKGQPSKGLSLEGYAGLSSGIDGDESQFFRTGVDLAAYIPVIKQNRLIIPRIVFDMLENINNDVPIAFTEYPRQLTFRGVSTRTLLRSDNLSFVPSLEYQWPLVYNASGHIFADYLVVAEELGDLSFSDSVWAVGFGIDIHSIDSRLARLEFSSGSEGFRFNLSIGQSQATNDRNYWE